MKNILKDPKKRQLLIGGVAAAGVVLFVLLRKKSTSTEEPAVTETGASAPVEQVPVESGGSSGSGSGTGSTGGEDALAGFLQETEQKQQAQQEQFATFLTGLASQNGQGTATTPETTSQSGHSGTPLAAGTVNTQANNPRAGDTFASGTYKGQQAHIYAKAVPGGVGPKGNIVVVGGASRTPSTPPQVNDTKNVRAGQDFKAGKYKGKKAHVYTKAVKGGVGPGKNIIIV